MAILLLSITCSVFAQTGQPIHDGHALDANPRVGSGGYNTPGSYVELNAANRYITGNTTGLSSFHGVSPIADPSLFRAGLGSAGLTFFNRQSVSLGDVMNRRTDAGLPFYARSQTIVGSGGIAAGLNQPGSSVPLSTGQQPGTGRLILQPKSPAVSEADLRRQGQAIAVRPVDAGGAETYLPYDAGRMAENLNSVYTLATTSTLFGVGANAGEVASPLSGSVRPYTSPSNIPAGVDGSPEASGMYSRIVQEIRDEAGEEALASQSRARLLERAAPSERNVIGEMLEGTSQRAADQLRDTTENQAKRAEEFETTARLSKAMLTAGPLRSFAEKNNSGVDALIAAGEQAIREGRYYDAARQFSWAASYDESNPLPRIARGHALAAAGDYLSASREIVAGIGLFPNVAMLDLDLTKLMGNAEVCRVRVNDLLRRLGEREDYELRFLLGYLRYYGGDAAAGVSDLLTASRSAPAGSVIANFPRMLGGAARSK